MPANKWVNFARTACPTRKGRCTVFAAYPRRVGIEIGGATVGLFGWFSNEDKIPRAVEDAAAAVTAQLISVRGKYSSDRSFEGSLMSGDVVLFIHGFVNHFARKHGLRRPQFVWAMNVLAFEKSFGRQLGSHMILQLQKSLADSDAVRWMREGRDAGRCYERDNLALLAAFLEGSAK